MEEGCWKYKARQKVRSMRIAYELLRRNVYSGLIGTPKWKP